MENKATIEYLDIVLLRITDISSFNVWTILKDNFDFDSATEDNKQWMLDLSRSVERLGVTFKYFEEIDSLEYRLTEKGIKAKEFGGHLEYQKRVKKNPLTLYQKIYLPFFICFGLFGVYKVLQPTVSVSDFHKLKTDFDSLKVRFDSIEKLTSKPILKQLNDTLQTKNLIVLNTG